MVLVVGGGIFGAKGSDEGFDWFGSFNDDHWYECMVLILCMSVIKIC